MSERDDRRQQHSGAPVSPRSSSPEPAQRSPLAAQPPLATVHRGPPQSPVTTYLDQPLFPAPPQSPSQQQPAPSHAPAAAAPAPSSGPEGMRTYYHVTPTENLTPSGHGRAMEASEGILKEGLKAKHGGSARGTKRVEQMGLEEKDKGKTHLASDPTLARSYYDGYESKGVPATVLAVQLSPRSQQRLQVDTGHPGKDGKPLAFHLDTDIDPSRLSQISPPPRPPAQDIPPPPKPPAGWKPAAKPASQSRGPRYAPTNFFGAPDTETDSRPVPFAAPAPPRPDPAQSQPSPSVPAAPPRSPSPHSDA